MSSRYINPTHPYYILHLGPIMQCIFSGSCLPDDFILITLCSCTIPSGQKRLLQVPSNCVDPAGKCFLYLPLPHTITSAPRDSGSWTHPQVNILHFNIMLRQLYFTVLLYFHVVQFYTSLYFGGLLELHSSFSFMYCCKSTTKQYIKQGQGDMRFKQHGQGL